MKHLFALALILSLGTPRLAAADDCDRPERPSCPASVPASLAPAADQRLRFGYSAVGVQVYVCTVNASGANQWLFVNPQANLIAGTGLAGTHFIGPTWQGRDGSSVTAAKTAGATVDPTSVPWLLLHAVSNVAPGRFASITSVQRLNTSGGIAPDISGCSASTLGRIVQVPYTADYFFYDTHTPGPDGNEQCR